MSNLWTQYLLLSLVAFGSVLGQLLIKRGLNSCGNIGLSWSGLGVLIREIFSNTELFLGCLISGIMTLLWLIVLSKTNLSLASPIFTAFYFIFLLLASAVFLHEPISGWRWGGVFLVIMGMTLAAKGS